MNTQHALRAEADRATYNESQTPTVKKVAIKPVSSAQKKPSAPKRNTSLLLRQWHQRLGIFAFVFMGWLGFSGILLNQSVSMGLDAIRVGSSTLMSLYGLHTTIPENGYFSAGHWLVTTTENTVLDDIALDRHIPSPLGFVDIKNKGDELLFVATNDKLTLLSPTGVLIEELSGYMLPVGHIRGIGIVEQQDTSFLALQGEGTYISADGLSWQEFDNTAAVNWSSLPQLDEKAKSDVEPYAHPTVALEQVLIDLHSGRLFGSIGSTLINFVGAAAVLLSISGIWMTWRTNRMRNARQKK